MIRVLFKSIFQANILFFVDVGQGSEYGSVYKTASFKKKKKIYEIWKLVESKKIGMYDTLK